MEGVKVTRGAGVVPDSQEGRELFASFFGEVAAVGDIKLFPHSIAAGEPTAPHLHTADVAACVTRGRFRFGTGEGFAETLDLEPGDYVFIRAQLPHSEEVLGDESVEFVVAHLEGFHTLEM